MKPLAIALTMSAVMSVCSSVAYAQDTLRVAIQSDQRSPANVLRDAARHPYETLNFFGIKDHMTVVELAPGGGWYTEILAPYLRQRGQLILAGAGQNLKNKMAEKPNQFDKVKIGDFNPNGTINYAAPNSVDMVLTFRNIHNWMNLGETASKAVFQSAFDSLKSGGVLGVVEHRLPATAAHDPKGSSGYVHTSYVIKLAESVGFRLQAQSEINANSKDTADHPGGVWALPPVLTHKEKDREKYLAIGESDRMTLKFVKP